MPWMEILMLAVGVALIVTMICTGQRAKQSKVSAEHGRRPAVSLRNSARPTLPRWCRYQRHEFCRTGDVH